MAKIFLVAGLAFGDEGKGMTTQHLVATQEATLVVRYNGGPQAAHNVIDKDGRHHTFSQFGSGTLISGVNTYLSKHMLVNPLSMMVENEHLKSIGVYDAFERTAIAEDCVIVTPYHRAANRLREMLRGDSRHGSCGVGVGVAREDHLRYGDQVILARDLFSFSVLRNKLEFLRQLHMEEFKDIKVTSEAMGDQLTILRDFHWTQYLMERYHEFSGVLVPTDYLKVIHRLHETIVFEGAQGVMLDETHGFQPHVTWTDTTFNNADSLLQQAGITDRPFRIGCLRTYATRHGAGPLPTEDPLLKQWIAEKHNKTEDYSGDFRFGWFDGQLARKAVEICGGIDGLALTHLDTWYNLPMKCAVDVHGTAHYFPSNFQSRIIEAVQAPIVIIGAGPTPNDYLTTGVLSHSSMAMAS